MKILYFARVRERLGVSEEEADVPDRVRTVAELAAWLAERGGAYDDVFGGRDPLNEIRAAVNHSHAAPDDSIVGAEEIAFFPPMTGG